MLTTRGCVNFKNTNQNVHVYIRLKLIWNSICLQWKATFCSTTFFTCHYYSTIVFCMVLSLVCFYSEVVVTGKIDGVFQLHISPNQIDLIEKGIFPTLLGPRMLYISV